MQTDPFPFWVPFPRKPLSCPWPTRSSTHRLASTPPAGCCSMGRRAPARRCWPRRWPIWPRPPSFATRIFGFRLGLIGGEAFGYFCWPLQKISKFETFGFLMVLMFCWLSGRSHFFRFWTVWMGGCCSTTFWVWQGIWKRINKDLHQTMAPPRFVRRMGSTQKITTRFTEEWLVRSSSRSTSERGPGWSATSSAWHARMPRPSFSSTRSMPLVPRERRQHFGPFFWYKTRRTCN